MQIITHILNSLLFAALYAHRSSDGTRMIFARRNRFQDNNLVNRPFYSNKINGMISICGKRRLVCSPRVNIMIFRFFFSFFVSSEIRRRSVSFIDNRWKRNRKMKNKHMTHDDVLVVTFDSNCGKYETQRRECTQWNWSKIISFIVEPFLSIPSLLLPIIKWMNERRDCIYNLKMDIEIIWKSFLGLLGPSPAYIYHLKYCSLDLYMLSGPYAIFF